MKLATEKQKERMREWYKNNRAYKIAYAKEYQKSNNYACHKTEKQRKIREVRRETRRLYPIKNKKCKCCLFPATEHHHNTTPIQIHEFEFVCHECHIKLDLKLNRHSKKQKGGKNENE